MNLEDWLRSYAESFPEYSEIYTNITEAAEQIRKLEYLYDVEKLRRVLAEENLAIAQGVPHSCPRCKSVMVLDEHIGLCDHCIELDVDCLIDW